MMECCGHTSARLHMYLDDTIEYGDGTCHHDGCGGHHHHHDKI